jgi:hypothetical protein
MALPAHIGPRPLIQSRNHFSQTVGLLGRVISPSQGRYLDTGQHKHRINSYTHETSMFWVGFEPTIPASERAKIVHALDRAAAVTGLLQIYGSVKYKSLPLKQNQWVCWGSDVRKGTVILGYIIIDQMLELEYSNPLYNGLGPGGGGPVIARVRCNRMKGYSWKYALECVANTRNKQKHSVWLRECSYIGVIFYFK